MCILIGKDIFKELSILNKIQVYVYSWANNPKRKELKNRECVVICRGKMNSCLVKFIDNNQMEVISRNAIRKAKKT